MTDQRKIVDEILEFKVPIKEGSMQYKRNLLWSEILATEGLLPTDSLHSIHWKKLEPTGMEGFGMMGEVGREYVPDDYYEPIIAVKRPRPETDDEYLKRKQIEAVREREQLEKEKLQYLTLKAKFPDL